MQPGMIYFAVTTRIRDALMLAAYWLFFVCIRVTPCRALRGLSGVCHGPVIWPWWKIFSINVVKLSVQAPTFGWAIWIYTHHGGEPSVDTKGVKRRNIGRSIDIVVDRRIKIVALHRSYPC